MKKLSIAVLLFLASNGVAFADVYVHGYTKSNGTYVESYHRSSPDGIKSNNYSYSGN